MYVDWQPPKGAGWFQIAGSIDESMAGNLGASTLNWCDKNSDNNGTYVIYLNSIGGNVGDALAIRGYIARCRSAGHEVVIIILGRASSCAVVIARSGDTVLADENSWLMIHEVTSSSQGGEREIRAEGAYVKRLNEQTFGLIATPEWPEEKIKRAVRAKGTVWLSAKEAWEKGLVNGILLEPVLPRRNAA